MPNPVNGLFAYNPSTAPAVLVAAYNGRLWKYDGANSVIIPGLGISSIGTVTMIQAQDKVYGTGDTGALFQFDGASVSNPGITDSASNPLLNVTDLCYFLGRIWFASGDFVYFTDPLDAAADAPVISLPALRIRGGAGDRIVRLVPYRDSQLVVFKMSESSGGSIHIINIIDNSDLATPGNLTIFPLYQGASIAIVAPHCITQSANNTSADIFYMTREGLRSLNFTSLDKLTQPTLPFSINLRDYFFTANQQQLDHAFGIVWEDEYFMAVPTGVETFPDKFFCYKLTPDKQSVYNGWSVVDTTPASSAAVIGFNNNKPWLYVGHPSDGTIRKAFAVQGDGEYLEISKRIDHGLPDRKKTPFKLYVNFDKGSEGTMNVYLIYQDGTEYSLGSVDVAGGGLEFPITFPATFGEGGIINPPVFDLHMADDGTILPDYYDVRVKITSNDFPRILGYELLAKVKTYRFGDENDTEVVSTKVGTLFSETLTAETLEAI